MNKLLSTFRIASPRRFRWYHAAGIFLVANALSIAPAGIGGSKVFYNAFRRPSVAPPDWVFAPTWLVLNVTSLIALYLVANGGPAAGGTHRDRFYRSEAYFWVAFATFNTLYFGLKSPVLGAVNTLVGLAATVVSVREVSWLDRRATALLAPRLVWLLLAGYVSAYVALYNRDEFLGWGPMLGE